MYAFDKLGNTNLQIFLFTFESAQSAKNVVSDSPGLVDFAIRLVNSLINLPNGQVKFFEGFKFNTEVL